MLTLRGFGAGLLAIVAVLAIVGPTMFGSPDEQDLGRALEGPSRDFLLGTDQLGRSVAARLAHGSRRSIGIAAAAVAAATLLGASLGVFAALTGWARAPVLAVVDVFQALPSFLGILLLSALFAPSELAIAATVALVVWSEPCRVALLSAEAAARQPAVEAARLVELSCSAIALRLVLPPLAPPLAAVALTTFGHAILSIAALGVLGLGLRPPTPEWGAMIAESLPHLSEAPRLILAPSLAIVATVTGLLLMLDAPE